MAWFGKRDPQILEGIERDIDQFPAHVQDGYSLKTVATPGGFRGRGINVVVDLIAPAVSARFSKEDLADLCHGRSAVIDAHEAEPPMFLATPESGGTPSAAAFDALQNLAPGSAALLKPKGEGMETLLVLDADKLAEIERWLETIPATK